MSIKMLRNCLFITAFVLCLILISKQNAFGAVYTAVKGDSLYKIGKTFNTNADALAKSNKLTTYNINVGQKLFVSCKTYKVVKGDTMYLISKKFGIPLSTLLAANGYIRDKVYIGQIINIPPIPTVTMTSPFSKSDMDLLARLIMAEAQGEVYKAKVAVGAVVMNRIKSSIFPNTMKDVIYEKDYGYYQFTPVLNGFINKPADQSSISAAYDAVNGYDPSNGALYYFDNTVTNKWLLSKPVLNVIGKLTFSL